ncbi:hypothetical protein V2J52_12700 [Georgenia sp. MJ173]|uniref:hypothetical protein n=1 Tax=Georgenia sunbinii TaxID=3117728 RepID=UPI002F26D642
MSKATGLVRSTSSRAVSSRSSLRYGKQGVRATQSPARLKTKKQVTDQPSEWSVVVDRLDHLLALLEPVLPDALLAASTGDDLLDLAGRISSALPHESATAEAVGPVYETADLVSWLGISRQALHKRLQRSDMLAMKTADSHTIYPAWQFTSDGTVRPGVAEAVKALAPVMDDWTRTLWFTGRSPDLDGKSASQWLAEGGDPAVVIASARRRAHRMAQ